MERLPFTSMDEMRMCGIAPHPAAATFSPLAVRSRGEGDSRRRLCVHVAVDANCNCAGVPSPRLRGEG
jgi:hypothetical protein